MPKTFDKSMENLAAKIEAKQDAIKEAEKKFKSAKKAYKNGGSQTEKANLEKAKKAIERLMEQLEKLEIQRTDKDENKTIALGTSKLNYLDPRLVFAFPFGMFPFCPYSIFNIKYLSGSAWRGVRSTRSPSRRFTTRPRGRSSGGPST